MKGAHQILAVAMFLFAYAQTLDTGIDKGTIFCSREKGNGVIHGEKGDHGYIVSGGYPEFYSTGGKSGLWCQIHIQVCSTCKVKVTFDKLSFAECSSQSPESERTSSADWCRPGCDHIHLFEVDTPYDRITHRDYFAGNESDHYTSISGNMKIRHCVGNTSVEDEKHFKIGFTVLDKTEQHQGVVYQYGFSGGNLTSPNFPHGYALNGETFTYVIQNLDPYGHVRLTFDDWDIAKESKVKVYDGLSDNSPYVTLDRYKRPNLLSKFSTLVVVLSTGQSAEECCFHAGFKAVYEFASEVDWEDRPNVSCSGIHALQGGGILSFTGSTTLGPQFFDCVWLIKRFSSENIADAVLFRLREVLVGDGWLQYGKVNSLEIRRGVTSQSPLLARYTARNITDMDVMFVSSPGLYVRLRGGFYSTDKLSFLFTAVKNVTADEDSLQGDTGCPGYLDFLCASQFCIDHDLMCDGVDHCGDGSDESPLVDCAGSGLWNRRFKWTMPFITESSQTGSESLPPCDGILCGYTCITLDQICDGYVDCPGREDEDNCVHQVTTTMSYLSSGQSLKPCVSIVSTVLFLFVLTHYKFNYRNHRNEQEFGR